MILLGRLPTYVAGEAVVPVRSAPSDASEMVTQLLFGDSCTLLEEQANWVRIRISDDGYEGWADPKMLLPETPEHLADLTWMYVFSASLRLENGSVMALPAGARVPATERFDLGGQSWERLSGAHVLPQQDRIRLGELADHFLNTPYLWGGRSSFGIDCSGFTQVLFRMCGIALPRDSGPQAETGEAVEYGHHSEFDLAFFGKTNPGRITHVGMLVGKDTIIHASGRVRKDRFTPEGILNTSSGQLTHYLKTIRRC